MAPWFIRTQPSLLALADSLWVACVSGAGNTMQVVEPAAQPVGRSPSEPGFSLPRRCRGPAPRSAATSDGLRRAHESRERQPHPMQSLKSVGSIRAHAGSWPRLLDGGVQGVGLRVGCQRISFAVSCLRRQERNMTGIGQPRRAARSSPLVTGKSHTKPRQTKALVFSPPRPARRAGSLLSATDPAKAT